MPPHRVLPRQTIDCGACDPHRPAPWPYDSPMPVVLPALPDLPYDRPENGFLPPRRPKLPAEPPELADRMVGRIYDVVA